MLSPARTGRRALKINRTKPKRPMNEGEADLRPSSWSGGGSGTCSSVFLSPGPLLGSRKLWSFLKFNVFPFYCCFLFGVRQNMSAGCHSRLSTKTKQHSAQNRDFATTLQKYQKPRRCQNRSRGQKMIDFQDLLDLRLAPCVVEISVSNANLLAINTTLIIQITKT